MTVEPRTVLPLTPKDEQSLRALAFEADDRRLWFTPSEMRAALATIDEIRTTCRAAALREVAEKVEFIRGIASGFGGDRESKTDPWNALTTIVINCDELLAILTKATGASE